MDKFEALAAALAVSDTGIYCKSSTDKDGVTTERTERQDGWNDCLKAITKKAGELEDWLENLPPRCIELLDAETLMVYSRGEGPQLWVLCNDLFYWACADGEDFELSDFPDLERALKETPKNGDILWCCRKRGMRPQKQSYKYFTDEEAKQLNACGPERDE